MDDYIFIPEPPQPPPKKRPIQELFEEFHERNPAVYDGLVELAREGIRHGRTKLGIGQLFEVIRWQWTIDGLPDDHELFKLNNNYRSRYSRLIEEREPDLKDMFEKRELRTP